MAAQRILVADDSLTIQKVIRLALSNEGYEIEAVSDGNDAAQQIPLFRPHVILVDVGLPGRTAYELKEDCNQEPETQSIKFVLMSSAFEAVDEAKVANLGFAGRLLKPFDPAHLRKTLNEVLHPGGTPTLSPPAGLKPVSSKPPQSKDSGSLKPVKESPKTPEPLWKEPEDDIRTLTEQTIKMSGLDTMEWNLNEPGKKPSGTKSGVEQVGEKTYTSFQFPDPVMKPPGQYMDTENVAFDMQAPPPPVSNTSAYFGAPENPFSRTFSDDTQSTEYPRTAPPSVPLPGEQIEAIITREVRGAVEKVLREQLPDIAERIIRDEIQKMLSNPPA